MMMMMIRWSDDDDDHDDDDDDDQMMMMMMNCFELGWVSRSTEAKKEVRLFPLKLEILDNVEKATEDDDKEVGD